MLPNFIIGGTAAGGTSFLSSVLMQHNDIYLPRRMRPEPHYFYYSHLYKNPIEWYQQKWFSEWAGQSAIGERSSSYLYMPACAERIHKHLPNVKLIFMIRNPIERTWANYRYTVLSGLEELDFAQALDQEQERIRSEEGIWKEVQPHDYTGRGFYGRQIRNFMKYFSLDQILLVSSEKLRNDINGQLNRICDFLRVSPLIKFDIPPEFAALSVENPLIQKQCRDYFKDRFDLFVEKIRVNDMSVDNLLLDNADCDMFAMLKANIVNKKKDMDSWIRTRLEQIFKNDSEDFFNVSGEYIDFDSSIWSYI
jgi:hypothetical protein